MTKPKPFPYAGVPVDQLDAAQLAEAIAHHNRLYYEAAQPVISDAEYDRLVDRLRALEPEHPVLHQVGAPPEVAAEDKVEHRSPMLSLDKCYTVEELRKWAKVAPGARLVATPKVDGLACSILYGADGRLKLAATRGDGVRGENVTTNARHIPAIPSHLPADRPKGELEVRGEVYLPLSVFATVSEQFANPRNLAAGTLKSKDRPALPLDTLRFLAYDVLGDKLAAETPTEQAKAELLARLGLTPAPLKTCTAEDADAVFAAFEQERAQLDYELDGVVLKFDDVSLQQRLGTTSHHPRGAIAWKFQVDAGMTSLVDVEWSVSRTGTITPVAIVAPVQLSGATVTRATLHNLSNVRRLGLRIGDAVELVRRGGVIPHLERTLGGGEAEVGPPAQCPSCGSPTREVESDIDRGGKKTVILVCSRPEQCTVARHRQLLHFCSALELEGFGEKIVDALLERGLVNDPADLYTLQAGDLLELPRLGELSTQNLLRQIDKARTVELPAFLVALGISSLGKQVAQVLASRGSLTELRRMSLAELDKVLSVAQNKKEISKVATAVFDGLRQQANLIDRLLEHVQVVRPSAHPAAGTGPFAGEVVVFTGALEHMQRRDAQQLVVRLGGLAGDSVTQDTTLVVVGGDELTSATPSSKLKKARKLQAAGQGIAIVPETDFLHRAGQGAR